MSNKFEDFLSENRKTTAMGKIYPTFGQVVLMIGEATTSFSERYKERVTISQLNKMVEMQNIFHGRLKEEGTHPKYFDLALTENIGTANILMQDVYQETPLHEVGLYKSQLLAIESRLPTMAVNTAYGDVAKNVETLNKLGYINENIHIVFNKDVLNVKLSESVRLIPESVDFGDVSSKDLLHLIENFNLGDVYVAFSGVNMSAPTTGLTEMQLKHKSVQVGVSEVNRQILSYIVETEAPDTNFGVVSETEFPKTDGFKAYDFKINNFELFEANKLANTTIMPTTQSGWNKLTTKNEVYFNNGWKLQHSNNKVVLTEAKEALRFGKTCTEYVFEIKEAGYPLHDILSMTNSVDINDIAESMVAMNGKLTPERQVIKGYSRVVPANTVYHPSKATQLRPCTESAVNDTSNLIRAIANNQFNNLVIETNTAERRPFVSVDKILESIVRDGVDVKRIDGNNLVFETYGTEYSITLNV